METDAKLDMLLNMMAENKKREAEKERKAKKAEILSIKSDRKRLQAIRENIDLWGKN